MRFSPLVKLAAGVSLALGFLLLCVGCELAGGGTGAVGAATLRESGPDIILTGDRLTVEFSDVNPAPPATVQIVREDGSITLPSLTSDTIEVKAAGKTKGELQDEIRKLYVPRFFRRLTVSVKADDRFFYVGGEVRLPARQPYIGQMTVLKAIQSAGGFTDFADRKRVEVTRQNGHVDIINCVKARKQPKLDLPIYPGDLINVPRRLV